MKMADVQLFHWSHLLRSNMNDPSGTPGTLVTYFGFAIGSTGDFRRPASVRGVLVLSRQRFLVCTSKRITSRRLAVDKSDYNLKFGSPVDNKCRQKFNLKVKNNLRNLVETCSLFQFVKDRKLKSYSGRKTLSKSLENLGLILCLRKKAQVFTKLRTQLILQPYFRLTEI